MLGSKIERLIVNLRFPTISLDNSKHKVDWHNQIRKFTSSTPQQGVNLVLYGKVKKDSLAHAPAPD
ncbi:unnamed protein product [Prunus armeniaca]